EEFNNTVPAGQIIRQSPAPGATVERGATITIVISKGQDLVTLPNIIGQTFEPATAALAAAGLGVNSVTGDGTQPLQSVSVNGAPATAGQQFLRGTKVDLAFAPTPAPPTTPPVP
ncbi:MAG: PASTA domain-containing protein, partial [Actinomycetota bacterium]|nr:PASTA domain-containing protein [Actinomycetota bacterium]